MLPLVVSVRCSDVPDCVIFFCAYFGGTKSTWYSEYLDVTCYLCEDLKEVT